MEYLPPEFIINIVRHYIEKLAYYRNSTDIY